MNGSAFDVRVREALQRARSQMAILVDPHLEIIWANDGAQDFLGEATAAGRPVLERVHPDDLPVAAQGLSMAVQDIDGTSALAHDSRGVFLRVMDRRGEWVTVDAVLENFVGDPDIDGMLVTLRRVSNRIHIDRAIEHLADDSELAVTLTSALEYLTEEMRAVATSITTRVAGETFLVGVAQPGAEQLPELCEGWGPHGAAKLAEPTVHHIAELPMAESSIARAAGVSHVVSLPIRDTHDKVAGAIIVWLPHEPVFVDPPNGPGRFVNRIVRLAIMQERAKRSLLHQARHDPLTGLANRIGLDRVLDNLGPDELPAALLYCDLDEFKVTNDTFGHSVGDLTLKQVARRISVAIRADDVAVRMGGDEFVVVCPRIGEPEMAGVIADRVRNRVEQPTGTNERGVTPQISIGWAIATSLSEVGMLVDSADDALYENKRARQAACTDRTAAD